MSALSTTSKAIPKPAIALGLAGLGSVATYLFLRSKTETVGDDLTDIFRLGYFKFKFDQLMKRDYTLADLWAETLGRFASRPFLHYIAESADGEDVSVLPWSRVYTYSEVDQLSNQVANWAIKAGIKQQEVVALMMDNRPEMIWTWLGLAKVGAVTALINTNLVGHPLTHSLVTATAQHFIIGSEHLDAVRAVRSDIKVPAGSTPHFYSYGTETDSEFIPLDPLLRQQSVEAQPEVAEQRKGLNLSSLLFYIYTSGTTGPPKASLIKQFRFYGAGMLFAKMFRVTEHDRVYCTLPMYHASGGMIGCGVTLLTGGALVFRKKFSAKRFWYDTAQFNASIMLYIGELCRYLVNSPVSPADQAHSLRLAIGNGLRPDVWSNFVERFGIPRVAEFYAATEGNANMVNSRNRFGAVGYVSPLMSAIYPIKIVKFDVEAEEPVRDSHGLCIECGPNEPGELLGRIDADDPTRDFSGYTNKQASEKKILHNVVDKGDRWFRTGDLLRRDENGFYYFVDRIGDTFRWKGENVATSEVAEIISMAPGVREVNVYGVQIPHCDGRAGMASLVVDEASFSFELLYRQILELPAYARPLFIRISPEIDITGTFKHKKHTLVAQGFDPDAISDPLFYKDDQARTFLPLTREIYAEFQRPNSRL